MFQAVAKRLTIRGFIVVDSFGQMPAYRAEAAAYLRDGRLKALETVVESSLDRTPQMFMDMLQGTNTGKMIVALRWERSVGGRWFAGARGHAAAAQGSFSTSLNSRTVIALRKNGWLESKGLPGRERPHDERARSPRR